LPDPDDVAVVGSGAAPRRPRNRARAAGIQRGEVIRLVISPRKAYKEEFVELAEAA
jgi:hypothetical protein